MYEQIRDVLFFYKKCFEDTQLRELARYTLTRNLLQLVDRPHMITPGYLHLAITPQAPY